MEKNSLSTLLQLQKTQAIHDVLAMNDISARFGLQLTHEQALRMTEHRFSTLHENGRVELGEGVLPKIIEVFCDSPYIMQDNYEDTLLALQEAFYYFKGEALERLTDDELISAMRQFFETVSEGSVEHMVGTALEDLCRTERYF